MGFKKLFASAVFFFSIISVSATAMGDTVLISGQGIGITLNSEGAMVSSMAEIKTESGDKKQPALYGGIKEGDVIVKVDDKKIKNVTDLQKVIEENKGKSAMVKVNRGDSLLTLKITPVKDENGQYKMGIWAKDIASGIGTLTFYDQETGNFGALGHGITDSKTGSLIEIDGGEVLDSTVVSVNKGEKGKPGELQGIFGENEKIGSINKNTDCGIFGKMELSKAKIGNSQSIKVGTKDDVRVGKAYILANVEGDKTEKFEIQITDIPILSGDKTKGMVIKITDKNLLRKTGGIVRGMSGSPIVQSGRLIGAVTHVFVNDPTRGYGIFIENMLAEAEKISD